MNKFDFFKEFLRIWELDSKYYILLPFVAKISSDKFKQNLAKTTELLQKWQK